jgi:hypothetical protein
MEYPSRIVCFGVVACRGIGSDVSPDIAALLDQRLQHCSRHPVFPSGPYPALFVRTLS